MGRGGGRDGRRQQVRERELAGPIALVGERKALTMTVQNNGVGKLSLTTLEPTEGAEVAFFPPVTGG